MRQSGYRIRKQREDFEATHTILKQFRLSYERHYHFFRNPITIYADDVLTIGEEEIKTGRHVKQCIGYRLKNGKFHSFIVELI